MYYLQSRYYDPAIGRFINADAYASTGRGNMGFNMFAYCYNNPINFLDASGCLPKWLDALVDTARNIWNAVTNFFSPDTGAKTETYNDGGTSGHLTVTQGYSDFSIGATGQERIPKKQKYDTASNPKEGFAGISGEASIINANGRIGTQQSENMGVYLNGSADALALSGYAGYQYKNGFGIGAGVMATALTGTVTMDFDIYGWSLIIGLTGDIGAIGAEAQMGFVNGVASFECSSALGIGGGFIVEVGLPERYY